LGYNNQSSGRGRREHLAIAVGFGRADDADALHFLDHPCRPVVADLELALDAGDGCTPALDHVLHGLVEQRVLILDIAAALGLRIDAGQVLAGSCRMVSM
jgi:hypothetical protein